MNKAMTKFSDVLEHLSPAGKAWIVVLTIASLSFAAGVTAISVFTQWRQIPQEISKLEERQTRLIEMQEQHARYIRYFFCILSEAEIGREDSTRDADLSRCQYLIDPDTHRLPSDTPRGIRMFNQRVSLSEHQGQL